MFEALAAMPHVVHCQAEVLETNNLKRFTDRFTERLSRVYPTRFILLNKLYRQAGKLVGENKRFITIVGREYPVLKDRHTNLSKMHYITLDIVGFNGNVFKSLPTLVQEFVDTSSLVPVLHQVQPALIAEQYASIVLHALALVVTEIARL